MKSLIGFVAGIAYMITIFGGVIMHLWGVIEFWQHTRGVIGFLIFICSIFTILLTEIYIFYQHVQSSGWFGHLYSTAATIHLMSFAVLLVLLPVMKLLEKSKANKLGLSEDEFDKFIRVGSMSPAELFSDYRESRDKLEKETTVNLEKESIGVNEEWLLEQVVIEDVEQKSMFHVEQIGKSIPFGVTFPKWKKFKELLQEDDELWEYSSPPETWQQMHGRAGYCVVRNGEIVAKFLKMQN